VSRGAKKLVDRETGVQKEMHLAGSSGYSGKGAPVWVAVEDDVPVEYDTFTIEYSCKSCHHKWAQKVTVPRRSS